MNLIFLDFDEVLNSIYYRYTQNHHAESRPFLELSIEEKLNDLDPVALRNLDIVLKETNAHLVISTSWRKLSTFKGRLQSEEVGIANFKKLFTLAGYPEWSIVGITPDTGGFRGYEIAVFLEEYQKTQKVDNYLIIDDGADFFTSHVSEWTEEDWNTKLSIHDNPFDKEWYLGKCSQFPGIWDNQKMLRTNPVTGLTSEDSCRIIAHFNKDHFFANVLNDYESYKPYYKKYN